MSHTCHWPGCKVEVPPKLWGCKQHWFKLPVELRSKIWKHYRPGQEIDKKPSGAYLDTALLVQLWIEKNFPATIRLGDQGMTQVYLSPLVGMHFRPPAKLVLKALPGGVALRLQAEPDNPYDAGAVQVWASPRDMVIAACDVEEFEGHGHPLGDVLALPEIMLGYLCSASNKKALAASPGAVGNDIVGAACSAAVAEDGAWPSAVLDWSGTGIPLVKVEC